MRAKALLNTPIPIIVSLSSYNWMAKDDIILTILSSGHKTTKTILTSFDQFYDAPPSWSHMDMQQNCPSASSG